MPGYGSAFKFRKAKLFKTKAKIRVVISTDIQCRTVRHLRISKDEFIHRLN